MKNIFTLKNKFLIGKKLKIIPYWIFPGIILKIFQNLKRIQIRSKRYFSL